ncbi:transposase-like protein [Bradyrhizobium liaoningense]
MKRARFTEEQIIAVLKEHEAGPKTADLARKHGVSEATIYNWKAKFGGMDVSEAKRLGALERGEREAEEASGRADARCGRTSRAPFKKMVGPAAKRAAIAHLQAVMSLSERRACSIVGADRKMIRYRSSRPPDAVLRGRLRDLPAGHFKFLRVWSVKFLHPRGRTRDC